MKVSSVAGSARHDVEERVGLAGVTFSRYVVREGPPATMPAERLVEHLTRTPAGIVS